MASIQQILQNMPIFGGVNNTALEFLIERARLVSIKENVSFFREGDLAQSMFVLEAGRVAVFRSYQGVQYKLRELTTGDCFGEMALMSCSVRSASVCALQTCKAIEIENKLLSDLYQQFPEPYTIIMKNMGREVCRRLNQADTRLFMYDVAKIPETKQAEPLIDEH